MILCSVGLEVLVPKGGMLSPEDRTTIPLNWKLRLPSHPLWAPPASESTGKKEVTVLVRVINPDYRGEIELLLHSRHKEKYVWNTEHSLGCLLALPCPVIKVNGELQ